MRKIAPEWMLDQDWPMYANMMFFVGSLLWVAAAIAGLTLKNETWEGLFALVASLVYVAHGPLYMIDWYFLRAEYRYKLANKLLKKQKDCLGKTDWYVLAILTFWLGTFGDLSTSCIDTFLWQTSYAKFLAFWTDAFATHLWVVSGACSLLLWLKNRQLARDEPEGKYRRLSLWPFGKSQEEELYTNRVKYIFDWSGWGDIFFLPGALGYAAGAYVCYFVDEGLYCAATQLIGSFGFLFQSILYFPALIKVTDRYTLLKSITKDDLIPKAIVVQSSIESSSVESTDSVKDAESAVAQYETDVSSEQSDENTPSIADPKSSTEIEDSKFSETTPLLLAK